MLINLSNHPQNKWSDEQNKLAKKKYGIVKDVPFPNIDPGNSLDEVKNLVTVYVDLVLDKLGNELNDKKNAVHLMGESTFTFQFAIEMSKRNIPCFASTTERTILENDDGSKTVFFKFVNFRPYF